MPRYANKCGAGQHLHSPRAAYHSDAMGPAEHDQGNMALSSFYVHNDSSFTDEAAVVRWGWQAYVWDKGFSIDHSVS